MVALQDEDVVLLESHVVEDSHFAVLEATKSSLDRGGHDLPNRGE